MERWAEWHREDSEFRSGMLFSPYPQDQIDLPSPAIRAGVEHVFELDTTEAVVGTGSTPRSVPGVLEPLHERAIPR